MKLDNDTCYRALAARDVRFDGLFFVGVTTTGIYCRPICPARHARQRSMSIFSQRRDGRASGIPPLLAMPARARAWACTGRCGGTHGPARRCADRDRGAQRRRQPGVARPRAWPQLATAPAGDPPGVRRLAGRAGSDLPPAAGEEVDRRDEFASDRGRPGQRLRQRAPVQCPLPLSLLDDPFAHAAGRRAPAPLARRSR